METITTKPFQLAKPIKLAKRIGPVGVAVASVVASGFLGFVGGALAARTHELHLWSPEEA